jgi:methylenetetrahydrofolate reductase (NADPH)
LLVFRFCNSIPPRWVRQRPKGLEDDKYVLLDFGLDVVTRLCETRLGNGAPGLHLYTVNQDAQGALRRASIQTKGAIYI